MSVTYLYNQTAVAVAVVASSLSVLARPCLHGLHSCFAETLGNSSESHGQPGVGDAVVGK